jgi:signal transduction histidine kinase
MTGHFGRRGWPLALVFAEGQSLIVDDLGTMFDGLPKAPWDEAARRAMLLPISRPGTTTPAGVLVLGISPRRAFDDAYRGFFELVAAHVSTAISSARAYEEERERAETLAELDRAKTTFFSNVSHELRTPLTLILGPIEEALARSDKALAGAPLETVHRSALRLLRLVNDLLDFSRVEADRLRAAFEPTDLAVLTAGLAGAFQSLVEAAGLRLIVDCRPLPEPVYVDRSQWEKVVLNLVSNAFKFTFKGTLTVRLEQKGRNVELSVADTGTGIPDHELPKIFERFHRIEGARGRTFEGTGIGLALVQEIVRQHGGWVGVESELGEGTTFVVSIPMGHDHIAADRIAGGEAPLPSAGVTAHVVEAAQWDAPSVPVAVPPVPEVRAAGPRILIADDNGDMRTYLVRLLSSRWTTEAVADGQAALEAARRQPPDLVLSDVMMPRMDGVALVKALREDAKTNTIPIILLSARAGEDAVVAGIDTGADDYLVKPFSAQELLSRVGTHLELAKVRRVWAAELEQMNGELEAFSYSVSHDLRAPLRAIDGFGKALLGDHAASLDAQGRHYLERIAAAAQGMSALIDGLLDLSRITRTPLHREPVNISNLAAGVIEELRRQDPARRVSVNIAEGLTATGDRELIRIALGNLLGNAWKYTAKRPEARISLGRAPATDGQVFFVRDNGAGFDMTYAGKLFSPFQRLHKASDFEGTGIGLATVQRIVARHGGRVSATAAVDAGATFFFTLGGDNNSSPGTST